MKHTYKISGMTCSGCQAKVQRLLTDVHGVEKVTIDLPKGEGEIEMSHHIPTAALQKVLDPYVKYKIAEIETPVLSYQNVAERNDTEKKSWFKTYQPIILLFAYITGITLIIEFSNGGFQGMRWMSHFMAGFFLAFCFFKLLNLKAFAESYSMYDIIAKQWRSWGYVYATLELALGIAYLTYFQPLATNIATFILMSVSIIGVIQTVMNKKRIKCACLGAVFDLPMSTVTIIEDAIMIAMSGTMIVMLISQ
jgi:copper chaperone CopZ